MSNGKLIVESNDWPLGTHCQWNIPAIDDKHYVNLEFENIDVRIAEFNNSPHTFPGRVEVNFRWGGPKKYQKNLHILSKFKNFTLSQKQ